MKLVDLGLNGHKKESDMVDVYFKFEGVTKDSKEQGGNTFTSAFCLLIHVTFYTSLCELEMGLGNL